MNSHDRVVWNRDPVFFHTAKHLLCVGLKRLYVKFSKFYDQDDFGLRSMIPVKLMFKYCRISKQSLYKLLEV